MNFFAMLFGRTTKPDGNPDAAAEKPFGSYDVFHEKDNLGMRHDSVAKAVSYWMMERPQMSRKDAFVMGTFGSGEQAKQALLELPCIHVAQDSGNLICTEPLIFGYYQTEDGRWEGIVCGDELSPELWEAAKAAFARHGGKIKNELKPQAKAKPMPTSSGSASKVVFVRDDQQERRGPSGANYTLHYQIHKGPDAASAKAFLQEHPVTRQLHYIMVETPEGTWGRDIDGIYKEG